MTKHASASNVHDNEVGVTVPESVTQTRLTTEEVRQGHVGDHVRHILFLSFAGAAIAMGVAYVLFFVE